MYIHIYKAHRWMGVMAVNACVLPEYFRFTFQGKMPKHQHNLGTRGFCGVAASQQSCRNPGTVGE